MSVTAFLPFSADPIRAVPEPDPAVANDERRLSRHQPEASVTISTKTLSACWTSPAARRAGRSIRRRKVMRSSPTIQTSIFVSAWAAVTDAGRLVGQAQRFRDQIPQGFSQDAANSATPPAAA